MVTNILDLSKSELAEYLASVGEPKYRADQIFQKTVVTNIPGHLREKLNKDFHCNLPIIEKELVSKDGTRKYLLRLQDDSLIECVLLTQDYGNTVCISSQVGCKMGCAFCASGKDSRCESSIRDVNPVKVATTSFVRNLTAGEMLAQVLLAQSSSYGVSLRKRSSAICPQTLRVVVMGSGEPFDNFENTIKFLQLVTSPDGINIGARNISVSTSGLPDKIRAFADLNMQVNLCISLHAPNDEIRKTIMPIAKRYSIKELIESAKYFFDKTKRRVIFEYALIDNVNCAPEHAAELSKLLKGAGFASHVNLINLNAGAGNLRAPSRETAKIFMDTLIKSGVSCTMRKSKGSDISGACGQLRAKFVEDKK